MPQVSATVQPGTAAVLPFEVETNPAEYGRAGAITLVEAELRSGGTVYSPLDSISHVAEVAAPTDGGASTPVDGDPAYSAGGGPDGKNVYDITVIDSSGFSDGDYVRAKDKDPAGRVYKVLDLPDGTTVQVHATEDGFDIEDGDVLEQVDPTGVYAGNLEVDVDDYLSTAHPTGVLTVVMRLEATGDDPHFDASDVLTWTYTLTLDLGGRPYRAG